jgi:hypothetical protein
MKTNIFLYNRIAILFSLTLLFCFSSTTNAQLYVTTANDIGVGTSSPALKTHFIGASGNPATSGTTQTGILRLQATGTNGVLDFSMNGTTAALMQATNSTNLGTKYPIAINPNGGNVGIGTTSPTSAAGTALSIRGALGDNRGGVEFTNQTPSTGSVIGNLRFTGSAVMEVLTGTTSTTGQFNFYTVNASGTNGLRMMISQDGHVGINTATPGTFFLNVNGTTACTGNAWTSDGKFKTNVDGVEDALKIINQLKPKTYFFDTANVYGMNFQSARQYGFIAQDLEKILPELVTSASKAADVDSSGNIIHQAVTYKAVYYTELIAILTKGIQEQQKTLEKQDSINTSLQHQIEQLSGHAQPLNSNPANTASVIDVNLKDGQSVVLDQNVPNPFAEQTTVNYFLPENVVKAQMLFYNSNGKLIQSVGLNKKGQGSINVFANDLSNGVYTYTLVVDGKIAETKRMVKQ